MARNILLPSIEYSAQPAFRGLTLYKVHTIASRSISIYLKKSCSSPCALTTQQATALPDIHRIFNFLINYAHQVNLIEESYLQKVTVMTRFAVRLLGHLKRCRRIREQWITPLIILGLADLIVLTNHSPRLAFEAPQDNGDFSLRVPLSPYHG